MNFKQKIKLFYYLEMSSPLIKIEHAYSKYFDGEKKEYKWADGVVGFSMTDTYNNKSYLGVLGDSFFSNNIIFANDFKFEISRKGVEIYTQDILIYDNYFIHTLPEEMLSELLLAFELIQQRINEIKMATKTEGTMKDKKLKKQQEVLVNHFKNKGEN